ncbi:protein of unknown function [Paucidesulfovibrio gracilis DSM 16080]|uniref:SiaC family regulatory phosphoprotein domain-containing protein n=1 Tax=Paucidesulfovibrio gracilis DSM 16080 TaxID=1121449 RepID=A0A1T4WYV7_9BACT|nr:DUF1987 domain-containing protein [Paucidesulfovibrio gracilis]SKA82494.1 protein of unknown function [Paucidesulfovibrio gracilis DSM 16080]
MTRYTVQGTKSSPHIDFDPMTGVLRMQGESYPENCSRFYGPMFEWLNGFLHDPGVPRVRLDMEIVYFNSSTSKTFMDLFDLLDDHAGQGRDIEVNWRYHEDNETAQECGEEFLEDVRHVRFNLVEVGD